MNSLAVSREGLEELCRKAQRGARFSVWFCYPVLCRILFIFLNKGPVSFPWRKVHYDLSLCYLTLLSFVGQPGPLTSTLVEIADLISPGLEG